MVKMTNYYNSCIEKQLITRQYHEKWKFTDYNRIIQKLQCSHVLSFSGCPISSDSQDNHDVPVSTCKFSNSQKDILAVANENGIVCIENIKKVQALKYVQTHKNTVYDIAWMPGSSQFVTVSGDNSAKLWDCQESNINLMSTFMGHKRSVRCVSFKPENTAVFATGSRDGSLMIWDARAWKKCAKFSHHLPDQVITVGAGSPYPTVKKSSISDQKTSQSVTGLVFQNDNTLISCGSMDKFIRVWDMRKTYSRSTSNTIAKYELASPNSGFSYLCMNTLGTKLYANCMDSHIYCFNINSYDPDPVAAFYGHTNGSFYVKSSVSFDGSYLMSGSSDEAAYIWNTRNAELSEEAVKPFVVLNSHLAEVTCVEMCPDNFLVVTCSDDGTFRLWDPFSFKNKTNENVDCAVYYDLDTAPAIKTKWKNKRKFKEIVESYPDSTKTSNCALHTKICRFYNVSHSSPCLCQEKFTTGKGEKRENDSAGEEESVKKRAAIKTEECAVQRPAVEVKLRVLIPTRTYLKRKHEDTSGLSQESQKSKKVNVEGVLTPLNLLDKNASEEDGCHKKLCEESKSRLTELSSPTSNLPNYIEDGTSPYIHKCRRATQKENDWLTKLSKTYKTAKISEPKPSPVLEKCKKTKLNSITLHKYFKVSSKGVEKTFSTQEAQKRGILTKVEI